MKLAETMQRRSSRRSSMNSLSLNTFDSGFDSGEFFAITDKMRQEMMIDYELDYVSKFNSDDYPEVVLDADEAFVLGLIKKEVSRGHPRRSSLPRVISVVEENHSIQERNEETEKIQLSKEILTPWNRCETCREGLPTNGKNGGRVYKRACAADDDIHSHQSWKSINNMMRNKPVQVFEKSTYGKRDVRRPARVSKKKSEEPVQKKITKYNIARKDSNALSSSASTQSREQICQLFQEESRGIFDYVEQQKQRRAKWLPGNITFKVKQSL
mmetsp:Transcript_31578/g.47726  ORF Transcript_31578/g.47726 Transcript_31578/m.47726 type:complete len:270 (+) Transcript_31578:144-953(+)